MMKLDKYELLKDLPMYAAGTIVVHEYEQQPSQFNSGVYNTEGRWYAEKEGREYNLPAFVVALIKWCSTSQRNDDNHAEWVKVL